MIRLSRTGEADGVATGITAYLSALDLVRCSTSSYTGKGERRALKKSEEPNNDCSRRFIREKDPVLAMLGVGRKMWEQEPGDRFVDRLRSEGATPCRAATHPAVEPGN
jgi:hypothetical protein